MITSPSFLKLRLVDILPPAAEPISDIEFIATNGYLIKKGLIEEDLIAEIKDWTQARYRQPDMAGANRIQDAFTESSAVLRLATHPAVLDLLHTLYGRRPVPFQTLNFHQGTQQATHSDAFHFHCWPQRWMCGVWVAMEDVNEDNGPLHYYPGSHRLPILDTHDTSATDNHYTNYEHAIQELIQISGLSKARFLPQKGDLLIWVANLLHGGDPINDPDKTRISQVTHYFFEGCDFYTPRCTNFAKGDIYFRDNLIDLSNGQPIRGSRPSPEPTEPTPSAPMKPLLQRAWRKLQRFGA